jgi:hypothetical protein
MEKEKYLALYQSPITNYQLLFSSVPEVNKNLNLHDNYDILLHEENYSGHL